MLFLQISLGGLKIPAHDGEIGFEISMEKEQFTARGGSKVTAKENAAIKTLLNTTYCFTELPAELQNHSYLNAQQHNKLDAQSNIKSDNRSNIQPIVGSDVKPNTRSDIKSDAQPDIQPKARSNIESDNQSNIESDAQTDIRSDTQLKIKLDTPSDVKPNTQSNVESDTRSNIESDTCPDIKSETQADIKLDNQSNIKPNAQSNLHDLRDLRDSMKKVLDMFENDVKESLDQQESKTDDSINSDNSQKEDMLQFLTHDPKIQDIEQDNKQVPPTKQEGLFVPRSLQVERKDTSPVIKKTSPLQMAIKDHKHSDQKGPAESNNPPNTQQVQILIHYQKS